MGPLAAQRKPLTSQAIEEITSKVTENVSEKRATWQLQHVLAEVQRQLRVYEIKPEKIDSAAQLIAQEVTGKAVCLGDAAPKITGLTRSNGTSVYQRADAELYTTQDVLNAEKQLLSAAETKNFVGLKEFWVEETISQSEENGLELTPSQARMVTELATSGRAYS